MKISLLTCYLIVCFIFSSTGQVKIDQSELEKITSTRYIQNTLELLRSSTPQKKNTVKILVYGQSLSEGDWWKEMKAHFIQNFPDANIIMKNLAIGGFHSQILTKTTKRDILDFSPDLIIFHVFGGDKEYEDILVEMRSLTSAEIIIWNDPQNRPEPNPWHEEMSYEILPNLAAKYKAMFLDVRTLINDHVKKNELDYAKEYTRDGIHFNNNGNQLLAGFMKSLINFNEKFDEKLEGLVKTYVVGKDIDWAGNKLSLPFYGNRVDVVTATHVSEDGSYTVLVDGKKPSEFEDAYNFTRPNWDGGQGWVWSVGSPVRVRKKVPWVNEKFTLTIDSIDYKNRYFSFSVTGSECGFEGNGNNREDFISNSGRVFIEKNEVGDSIAGDWHIFRSFDVTGLILEKGYNITWETYLKGTDVLVPEKSADPTIENSTTIIQGIKTEKHSLQIVNNFSNKANIKMIKVYRPFIIN